MKITDLPEAQGKSMEELQEEMNNKTEFSPEELDRVEKFLRSTFIRTNKYTLSQIYNQCRKKNCILEDLRKEIDEKKSSLSRMQRDFLLAYKLDFIQQSIDDMLDAQERYREYAVQSK